MSQSAVANVVSQLVRASMGASVPDDIADDELDKHVAQIILQEAMLKEKNYSSLGIDAYLPAKFPESSAPRPNKRFLSSVIKNTDDHNKAVLEAQAQAAAEIQLKKAEEERRVRRSRAAEASDSRRSSHRDHHRSSRRRERSPNEDHYSPSSKRKRRSRERSDHSHSYDEPSTSRRHSDRHDSPSDPRDSRHRHHNSPLRPSKHRSTRDHRSEDSPNPDYHVRHEHRDALRAGTSANGIDADQGGPSHRSNDRPISEEPSHQATIPQNRDSSSNEDHQDSIATIRKHKFRPITRPRSPSPPTTSAERPFQSKRSVIRPRSPSPQPVYSSRMDKYFAQSYDPRLDSAALSKEPIVPKEGLIPAEDFEGWDSMLELIKVRQQDRAERKRSEAVFGVKESKKKKKKDSKGLDLSWQEVAKKREVLESQEPGIMDIRYQRQGTMREWDMGKADSGLIT